MIRLGGLTLAIGLLAIPAFSQGRLAELQLRFSREPDPVHRARLMPALGHAEFQEIQRDAAAEQLPQALKLLQQYRDEATSCAKDLDARGVDAERHASGYKQLEISLREVLRLLDPLLAGMTVDEQAPFLDVRTDLDGLNRHLIEELFPSRAAKPKP